MSLERLAATHSQSQIEYESTKTAQLCLITVNSTRALTNKTNHDLTLINNQIYKTIYKTNIDKEWIR